MRGHLSRTDTDLVEVTLTTLVAVDALFHLLRTRRRALEALSCRFAWQEALHEARRELEQLDDALGAVRSRAQALRPSCADDGSAAATAHRELERELQEVRTRANALLQRGEDSVGALLSAGEHLDDLIGCAPRRVPDSFLDTHDAVEEHAMRLAQDDSSADRLVSRVGSLAQLEALAAQVRAKASDEALGEEELARLESRWSNATTEKALALFSCGEDSATFMREVDEVIIVGTRQALDSAREGIIARRELVLAHVEARKALDALSNAVARMRGIGEAARALLEHDDCSDSLDVPAIGAAYSTLSDALHDAGRSLSRAAKAVSRRPREAGSLRDLVATTSATRRDAQGLAQDLPQEALVAALRGHELARRVVALATEIDGASHEQCHDLRTRHEALGTSDDLQDLERHCLTTHAHARLVKELEEMRPALHTLERRHALATATAAFLDDLDAQVVAPLQMYKSEPTAERLEEIARTLSGLKTDAWRRIPLTGESDTDTEAKVNDAVAQLEAQVDHARLHLSLDAALEDESGDGDLAAEEGKDARELYERLEAIRLEALADAAPFDPLPESTGAEAAMSELAAVKEDATHVRPSELERLELAIEVKAKDVSQYVALASFATLVHKTDSALSALLDAVDAVATTSSASSTSSAAVPLTITEALVAATAAISECRRSAIVLIDDSRVNHEIGRLDETYAEMQELADDALRGRTPSGVTTARSQTPSTVAPTPAKMATAKMATPSKKSWLPTRRATATPSTPRDGAKTPLQRRPVSALETLETPQRNELARSESFMPRPKTAVQRRVVSAVTPGVKSTRARAPATGPRPSLLRTPLRTPQPRAASGRYQADLSRKVDVEVGKIVNKLPASVPIKAADGRGDINSGKYWIGEPPKLCFCRILRSQVVMVRVGGGWQQLEAFLRTHFGHVSALWTMRFISLTPWHSSSSFKSCLKARRRCGAPCRRPRRCLARPGARRPTLS